MAGVPHVNYEEDKEKCARFLQTFESVHETDEQGKPLAVYLERLQSVSNREIRTFEIRLDDVAEFDGEEDLLLKISRNTLRYQQLFEDVVEEILPEPTVPPKEEDVFDILIAQREQMEIEAGGTETSLPAKLRRRFEVVFRPTTKTKPMAIRNIRAKSVGRLVSVFGIVTRVTDVKPEISVATYICDQCGHEVYQEITSRTFKPMFECPVRQCRTQRRNGRLQMQTRGSKLVKFQEMRIQERPSDVPVGHIPRAMTVHLHGELTRTVTPGDVVCVSGVFLPVPQTGFRAIRLGLVADTYIEAMNVMVQKKSYSDYELTEEELQVVEQISEEGNVLNRLAMSIAPEIHGHEDVKKALLLLLAGGVTRSRSDGMKIRGDIHICLMGDPGVAKSQLLRHIAAISPRGVYTTGKGSSGVGLTAAVMRDAITGELVLEGGALVLADMGVCCIDEFDKMDEQDRTAIHEVMEQQTVSIAKAGIQTTLNARASVLAAANPAFGRYSRSKAPSENINLPAALLSRFDLLFVITDEPNVNDDLELARHITYVHRNGKPPAGEYDAIEEHVLGAYISQARMHKPVIEKETTDYIVSSYVHMRMTEQEHGEEAYTYTTPRTLLSILRMSLALARLRFSDVVNREDIQEAITLMEKSKEALTKAPVSRGGMEIDAVSAVYSIIRDHAAVTGDMESISVAAILPKILARGYTQKDLQECLEEYARINVFQLSNDRSEIQFVSG